MASGPTDDVDFWEFVSCAKCHLPYASEPGKSVPFWLTECGHVICNHHLSPSRFYSNAAHVCDLKFKDPDQSCASCGATGILLVSLHQELDAPMSDWFKSLPSALDLIAYATKFQQEVMARQIRFYRSRHQQIRTVIEKLRSENSELKRANESLAFENGQLKQQLGFTHVETRESSTSTNHNGKRPMDVSTYQYDHASRRPRTDSSPHANMTPNRLTLPAGQHTPELARSKENLQNTGPLQPSVRQSYHGSTQGNVRPMSRQIGPPETSHAIASSLSQAQLAPKLIRTSQSNPSVDSDMVRINPQAQTVRHHTNVMSMGQQATRSGIMGPPALPQSRLGTPAPSSTNPTNRRFIPAQNTAQPQPQPSTSHGQRFFLGNSGNNRSHWQSNSMENSGSSKEPPRRGHG